MCPYISYAPLSHYKHCMCLTKCLNEVSSLFRDVIGEMIIDKQPHFLFIRQVFLSQRGNFQTRFVQIIDIDIFTAYTCNVILLNPIVTIKLLSYGLGHLTRILNWLRKLRSITKIAISLMTLIDSMHASLLSVNIWKLCGKPCFTAFTVLEVKSLMT